MSAPNGWLTDFYPGTFNGRPAQSFNRLFGEIHRRVTEVACGGRTLSTKLLDGDILDLLSGHHTPMEFIMPSGKSELQFIQLENVPRIDEKTRLLLQDMARNLETPFVIDRLSRMALSWSDLVFRLDRITAIVVNPRATQCLSIGRVDPTSFLSLVDPLTVRPQVGAQTAFGDVIIERYNAAQYALMRANFEPVAPPGFPYVLRARFGLRMCVVGITAAEARMFGPLTKYALDITNRRLGRLLVPGLYT